MRAIICKTSSKDILTGFIVDIVNVPDIADVVG